MASVIEQLNTIDYSRQAELDNILTNKMSKNEIMIIVGCGGIGFWLGLQLAMLGYRHFILIDGGKVDYSNLNRLPVPQTWVGINKAVALRKVIRSMRLDTVVMALSTNICKDTLSILKNSTRRFRGLDNTYYYINSDITVWDTTDDAKIQTQLHDYVKDDSSIEYRKLGYEAFDIGCYKEYSVWTADDYQTGYRTSNANAVTSAISAGIGIFARCLTDDDVELNLKSLIKHKAKIKADETIIKKLKIVKAVLGDLFHCYNNSDDYSDKDIMDKLDVVRKTFLQEGVL